MISVEIKTKEKTIQEKIQDWRELKDLLLKYDDYISCTARNNEERKSNEERHTR